MAIAQYGNYQQLSKHWMLTLCFIFSTLAYSEPQNNQDISQGSFEVTVQTQTAGGQPATIQTILGAVKSPEELYQLIGKTQSRAPQNEGTRVQVFIPPVDQQSSKIRSAITALKELDPDIDWVEVPLEAQQVLAKQAASEHTTQSFWENVYTRPEKDEIILGVTAASVMAFPRYFIWAALGIHPALAAGIATVQTAYSLLTGIWVATANNMYQYWRVRNDGTVERVHWSWEFMRRLSVSWVMAQVLSIMRGMGESMVAAFSHAVQARIAGNVTGGGIGGLILGVVAARNLTRRELKWLNLFTTIIFGTIGLVDLVGAQTIAGVPLPLVDIGFTSVRISSLLNVALPIATAGAIGLTAAQPVRQFFKSIHQKFTSFFKKTNQHKEQPPVDKPVDQHENRLSSEPEVQETQNEINENTDTIAAMATAPSPATATMTIESETRHESNDEAESTQVSPPKPEQEDNTRPHHQAEAAHACKNIFQNAM